MKIYLYSLFLILSTACTNNKSDSSHSVSEVVKMDPVQELTTVLSPDNTFNCVIITGDSIYCYNGNEIQSGAYYSVNGNNTFRKFLEDINERKGDSLAVLLKPTVTCTYRNTVDILDEMTINRIKRYVMVKVNEEEKAFLHITEYDANPPAQIEIKTPPSETSYKMPDKDAFLIEIRKGGVVWYKVLSGDAADSAFHKINNPVTGNLKKAIATYLARFPDTKKMFLIKGHNATIYKSFEEVLQALKENNILKYNLIYSEENAATQ